MITVFTPTYNRAYIISNLYYSLKNQTDKDFEWLVVDDGSSDNTEELFSQWLNDNNEFTIRYYKKENGGKHRAVNYGLDLAYGEYFFVVDSDDYLTNDAVEKLNIWMNEIKDSDLIMGVVANRGYSSTETVNHFFKEEFLDMPLLECNYYQQEGEFVLNGERALCFKTEFHRKYKYPEFDNEKFVTEAIAWNRMSADGYLMRFYNDIIWIFEYLEDGYTKSGNSLYLNNPHGYGLWFKEIDKFRNNGLVKRLKTYYWFTCELKDTYDDKLIAECIDIPVIMVKSLKFIHTIISLIRK